MCKVSKFLSVLLFFYSQIWLDVLHMHFYVPLTIKIKVNLGITSNEVFLSVPADQQHLLLKEVTWLEFKLLMFIVSQ